MPRKREILRVTDSVMIKKKKCKKKKCGLVFLMEVKGDRVYQVMISCKIDVGGVDIVFGDRVYQMIRSEIDRSKLTIIFKNASNDYIDISPPFWHREIGALIVETKRIGHPGERISKKELIEQKPITSAIQ